MVSFGGTKNGCMGVEAVVMFDPAKAWEFELRRKRGGHLFSKHRFLSAQMEAYLQDDLWLRLATHANQMGARLVAGMQGGRRRPPAAPRPGQYPVPRMAQRHPYPGRGAGGEILPMARPPGPEAARLVASWSTTEADVDGLIAALKP